MRRSWVLAVLEGEEAVTHAGLGGVEAALS